MACPLCGDGDGTHVDHVYVAARREDADFVNIHVSGLTGQVDRPSPVPAPEGPGVGQGRRHRFALTGWCEMCGGQYAIVFTQHKGATLIETVPVNTEPTYQTGQQGT